MNQNILKGDQAVRVTSNKERWEEMNYGGVLSYLRRQYTRDCSQAEVVVSGIPYDCAVTNRPGCRFGPRAIRAASTQLFELDAFPYGFDVFSHLSVIDYGDCMVNPHHPETIVPTIENHATQILASGCKMLTFGGDHFITYPLLRAFCEKYGPIALLQFDAHCDTWEDSPGRLDHGTMFARAAKEGIIDVSHSIQVGLRTFNPRDYGFEVLTSPWIHRHGIDATIERVLSRLGDQPVYFTFDVDGLDPAFAPGTGTPTTGGLTSWQAIELVQCLQRKRLVGMDIVEVAPAYDHSEITAIAAATMGYQWLCQLAIQKGALRE